MASYLSIVQITKPEALASPGSFGIQLEGVCRMSFAKVMDLFGPAFLVALGTATTVGMLNTF